MAITLIAKIAARAKQLRAKSPSMTWQSALKKAGAEYRGSQPKTTSKRRVITKTKRSGAKKSVSVGSKTKIGKQKSPIQYKGFTINYLRGEYRADSFADGQITDKSLARLKKKINEYLKPKKRVGTVERKSKVGDLIYNAYKKAPIAIKKIIDQLGDEPDYKQLQRAAAALKKKGYFMDYGLDAGITALRPIKKTTIKKVGEVYYYGDGKKVGNSTTGYKVIGKKNGQMVDISDYPMSKLDAMKFIKQQSVENYYTNVVVVPYRGKKAIKKLMGAVKKTPVSKHKDTKSHNVNIRVMSGVKKPKVQKADVDMSALNGVIKFQANKFYEVAKGANKGSVIKITSVRKPTNKNEGSALVTSYNVNFYEYRDGHLCKPFLGVITDRWLNKRSIRPRQLVKSTELKKYI